MDLVLDFAFALRDASVSVFGSMGNLLFLIIVSFFIEMVKLRIQRDKEVFYEGLKWHIETSTMLPVPDAVQWVTVEWFGNRGTPIRWTCMPLKPDSTLKLGDEIVSTNMIGRVIQTHRGKP